jgi:hypothetical protein
MGSGHESDEILGNRAKAGGGHEWNRCEECGENLVFAMEDNHHKFSVGVGTVLECLRIAEGEGAVPRLPNDWWAEIMCRYHGELGR